MALQVLERQREISHSQKRRRQCDQGGRDCSDAATIQRMPAATETGRGKEWVLPGYDFSGSPVLRTPPFQLSDTDIELLASRTVREQTSVVLSH